MNEKLQFEAEIQQLLNIVINSLYTDREIFLRELVSNATDACERLRFLQASGSPVHQGDLPLRIEMIVDEASGTLSVIDTGCGMSREELIENLGTIARSGSKTFLSLLNADEKSKPDISLIGQFGVGFYSAFMVASDITVHSRSYRPEERPWVWRSAGMDGFQVAEGTDQPRGTRIALKMKEDAKDLLREGELERILKKYSKFVPFPLSLNGKPQNSVQAIWSQSRSSLAEEDYHRFYQFLGPDQQPPAAHLHFNADAPLSIQAVLFVPGRCFETPGLARIECEVHLYSRKVLIQSRAAGLLPDWLRFLKGVVDCEDLPLNISRETMQDNTLIKKLNKVITSRFLRFLEELATEKPERFDKFYQAFARFLKEGIVTDFVHAEALGRLLRYESSAREPGQLVSLAEYASRMQPEQKEIYYLVAPSREVAEASPYFEVFKSRHLEVLFLYDAWDEFVMEHLHAFDSRNLVSAEKADIQVQKDEAEALGHDPTLSQWLKEVLGNQIEAIEISKRLTESPAVLIDKDPYMTAGRKNALKNMKTVAGVTPFRCHLEINPDHPAIVQLNRARQTNPELARTVAEQILDNARIAAGLLEDPRKMLKRLNLLVERALAAS